MIMVPLQLFSVSILDFHLKKRLLSNSILRKLNTLFNWKYLEEIWAQLYQTNCIKTRKLEPFWSKFTLIDLNFIQYKSWIFFFIFLEPMRSQYKVSSETYFSNFISNFASYIPSPAFLSSSPQLSQIRVYLSTYLLKNKTSTNWNAPPPPSGKGGGGREGVESLGQVTSNPCEKTRVETSLPSYYVRGRKWRNMEMYFLYVVENGDKMSSFELSGLQSGFLFWPQIWHFCTILTPRALKNKKNKIVSSGIWTHTTATGLEF